MEKQSEKLKIASGMRPTGKLHLGHYIGVLKNWVKLQDEFDCHYFVADWHALTTKYDDTADLRQNTIDVVIDWLASGIDPGKSTIYVQSLVPEIAELHIYFSMITPQHLIERNPNFKDMLKMSQFHGDKYKVNVISKDPVIINIDDITTYKMGPANNNNLTYGLMGYPVLQAADILIVNASCVPVGKDQVAHVEMTRDIARRFNNIYKTDFFNEPVPKLTEVPLLYGLDGQKMGKSYNNDIKISDDEETTTKKIMRAVTDPSRIRKDDLGHTDKCEVAFKYWQIFGDSETVAAVKSECEKGARGCADCKRQLAAVINEKFAPIREKRKYYENHLDEVIKIIEDGSQKARVEAQKVLKEVRKLVKMY